MKKFVKIFFILIAVIVLLLLIYVLLTFPPIMRGMAAKTMCSCVFVTGRSPESVKQKELQVFPGLDNIPLDIDFEDSTVTANMLFDKSKAIFRKGLGCTLLAQAGEDEVRKQAFEIYNRITPDQDTIPWPGGDLNAFATATDIDRNKIEKVLDDAFTDSNPENPVNTHAVVVVHRGKIIGERYAAGFGPKSILSGWSMTKSITNALIGILVRQGKLQLRAPAPVELWKQDNRREITIDHLLHASSGLEWSESYFLPGADFHNMFILSDDKAAYAASRRLKHQPGTVFEYSSGTTNILSKIIRETVGEENYHRFPYEALFSEIGMHHAIIEPDASGTFVASSYGFATARDWARLGLLYLNDGVWGEKRILPEGWVEYTITPAPASERREYGGHVWLNLGEEDHPENMKHRGLPRDAILFEGFEENFVVIVPSKELIIVRLGVTHGDFNLAGLVTGIIEILPNGQSSIRAEQLTSN